MAESRSIIFGIRKSYVLLKKIFYVYDIFYVIIKMNEIQVGQGFFLVFLCWCEFVPII